MPSRFTVVAAIAALSLVATVARAADPGATCAAAKQKAAAKKLSDKVKCHGSAIKKGVEVDAACLSKAEEKFDSAFAKAEAKGGCVTVGDAAAIETLMDSTLTQLLTALPAVSAPPTCNTLPTCNECAVCEQTTAGGPCLDELQAFNADGNAQAFVQCISVCSDQACVDSCGNTYPTAAALYVALAGCISSQCTLCQAGVCGNGACEPGENASNCLADCPVACGNGVCESGEDLNNCPADCLGWTCDLTWYGDGECDCGCGITDSDCADSSVQSCQFCVADCNVGSGYACPGNIDPTNNAQCLP